LIQYLRQRSPFQYVLLFVLVFALNISLFFHTTPVNIHNESLIFDIFSEFTSTISNFWYVVISLLTTYFVALFINHIFNKFKLLDEINLFPAFIFIITGSMFPGIILLSPASISFIILLIVIYNLLYLFDMEGAVQHLFFTAFYLSIASLIFFPVIILIVFIIISYPILKRLNWREFIIIIIGIWVPFHLLMIYYYWNNSLTSFISNISGLYSGFRFPLNWKPVVELIPVSFLFLVLFIGFVKDSLVSGMRTVQKSRFMRVFAILLIITSVIFIFFTSNYLAFGIFLLLPVSFFLSTILTIGERRLNKIFFFVMIIISLGMQILKIQ